MQKRVHTRECKLDSVRLFVAIAQLSGGKFLAVHSMQLEKDTQAQFDGPVVVKRVSVVPSASAR
ncbi:MAG: hypothetical protein ABI234_15280 [Ktedonobacteraceae bacterium]